MKYLIRFIITLILTIILVGCSSKNDTQFNSYEFENIIYISPLSPVSKDYIDKQMEGAVLIILKNTFKIQYKNEVIKITKPVYKEIEINDDYFKVLSKKTGNIVSFDEYEKKQLYQVYSEDKISTNYSILTLDDDIWLIIGDDDLIMHIYSFKER